MFRTPKTSTAILLALSLAQPLPVLAQDATPEGAICADGNQPPCAEGVELILPEGAAPDATEDAPAAEEGAAEGEASPPAESQAEEARPAEPAPAEQAEEAAPAENAEQPAESAAQENAEQPAEAAPQEGAETPAEASPQENAEQPAEGAAPQESAEQPAEQAAPQESAEQPAEEETPQESAEQPAEGQAPQQAADQPAEQPSAEEPVPQETATDDQPATAPESAADAAAPETTPAAPARPASEAAGDQPAANAEAAGETAADGAEGGAEATASAETPSVQGTPEERAQAEQILRLLGASPEGADAAGEAPAAAAAAPDAQAETTVETAVTEEDTRQSDEDFRTTASGEVRQQAAQSGGDGGGGGGLSDFEKAALVGLAGLAVGAIINNAGDEVVANTGDRVVVRRGENDYYVLRDDDTLLRQPGSNVRTERFADGSTRSTVIRANGSQIVTIRDAAGRVLRRTRIAPDGTQVRLIDDTETYEPVQVERLPEPVTREVVLDQTDPVALRRALEAAARDPGRSFSLRQVRDIERVRKLVPEIVFDPVTFRTGSAAIDPTEAEELARLGDLMAGLIDDNPREVFLIEGHTDAIGSAASNLALSDRRAESVALALTEYFDVPPENMVVQGYGEGDLKVETLEEERLNRRVSVRRITPLLDQRMAQN